MARPFRQHLVFGAGALGSWLGARLDPPAVLIARGEHRRALRDGGLRLVGLEDDRVDVAVRARPPQLGADALVLVTVKTGALPAAARALRPRLAPDTVVAVLANGLHPDRALAALLGRPVVRVVAEFGAELQAPGRVAFWGGRALVGPGRDEDRTAAALATTGLPVVRIDDLERKAWEKLVLNCVANPLAGLTGLRNCEIAADRFRTLRRAVAAEGMAVAAAAGVPLPAGLPDRIDAALGRSSNFNSMAQDMARGRATEIDDLNGVIVALGEDLGVPTPVNRLLADAVRLRTAASQR